MPWLPALAAEYAVNFGRMYGYKIYYVSSVPAVFSKVPDEMESSVVLQSHPTLNLSTGPKTKNELHHTKLFSANTRDPH